MGVKYDEKFQDLPCKSRMWRRKSNKQKEAREDAHMDINNIFGPSLEDLEDLERILKRAMPLAKESK